MICGIIKWMISQSLDVNDRLPAFAGRHIENCPSCRQFLAASRLVGDRLKKDAEQLQFKPVFASERFVRRDYSLQLVALTACVLIVSGFLAMHSIRSTTGDSAVMLETILPQDGITGLLSGNGISAVILAESLDRCLSREVDYLAQDVRSATECIADSIPFSILELN